MVIPTAVRNGPGCTIVEVMRVAGYIGFIALRFEFFLYYLV